MIGTVKWFDEEKGFGFIVDDNDNEYFVHVTKLINCDTLQENDQVEFEHIITIKGNQAFDVKIIRGE